MVCSVRGSYSYPPVTLLILVGHDFYLYQPQHVLEDFKLVGFRTAL